MKFVLSAVAVVLGAGAALGVAQAQTCSAYGSPPEITVPPVSTVPDCAKAGGTLLGGGTDGWSDGQGNPRYACVWYPKKMPTPCPLLIYLHTSSKGTATQPMVFYTKVNTASLNGGVSNGYCLLAVNGTNQYHNYPPRDELSNGWDNWYRAMSPEPGFQQNVDAESIDHFIAEVSSQVSIDKRRIYMTGWSNGASMAILYAANRSNIAGVAVYSGSDPWAFLQDPCEQTPPTVNSGVPMMIVHKDDELWGLCPNEERMVSRLRGVGIPVTDILLHSGHQNTQVQVCNPAGGTDPNGDASNPGGEYSVMAHAFWPTAWTDPMLSFLSGLQLPATSVEK